VNQPQTPHDRRSDKTPSRWRLGPVSTWLYLGLCLAYPLGIAPISVLGDYLNWPGWFRTPILILYWPLITLADHYPALQHFLRAYIQWFQSLLS
jgi:hypothetical protein